MFEDLISGAKTTDLGPGEVLPIGGEEMAWTIVDGVVELYATLTAAGWGKRIGRLEEGEILFGIAATAPVELSLRAAPTARLAIVSTGEFEKCRVDPELAYGLERWVIALSGCLCEGEAEGAFVNLSRNRTTSIQAGKRVRPSYDVSWVRAAGGGWSFLDDHVLALSDSTFPLAPSTWLTCVEDGELSVLPTDAYLERVSPWGDLAQFHATVLGLIGQRLRQEAEDELTRVRASRKAGEQMFEGAIAGLSSILGRANDGFKFAREDGEEEAELAVCRLVGERMGIEINARPGTLKSLETPGQRISEIARHSNVRLRRIGFAPGWWKGEGVPTIGFSSVDQRVVALLPRSRRGYDVIDPKNGTRARMTDDVAPELCPVGYILYRPLPSRVISTFEFIRFGLQGSIRDLLTAVAAGFAICLLSIVIPLAARWIFDAGVPLGDRQGLLILAGAAGVGVLASTLFQLVVNVALLRGTGRISDVLEPAIWDRLLRLPLSFFRGFPSGDLAERAMAISSVRQRITTATLALLLGGVYGLAHLILLFVFDAPLGVIALGLVLVAFVGTLASSVHELKQQRCLRETHQGIASRLLEYLGSIAKIRVAGVEKSVFSIWARDLAAEKRITHQSHRARSRLAVLHSVFPIVILFLFVLIISTRDVPIESTGTFVGFTIAFGAFLASALETVSTLRTLLGAISRVERVRPILDAVPSIEATDPWIDLEGHIEMDHVSFGYSAELAPVVEDVSLEIRVGESVAIFGPEPESRRFCDSSSGSSGPSRVPSTMTDTIWRRSTRKGCGTRSGSCFRIRSCSLAVSSRISPVPIRRVSKR